MVDTPPDGISGQARGNGFGQPEITLGLIPGGGGTQMLTKLVGPAKALELSLMRPFLTAQEAKEFGLVTRIVPREKLIAETVELAVQLAKRAPSAVAAIKDCVYIGASRDVTTGIRHEQGNLGAWYVRLSDDDQACMPHKANAISFLSLPSQCPCARSTRCDGQVRR